MKKLPARNATQDQTGLQASAVTVWGEPTSVGLVGFLIKTAVSVRFFCGSLSTLVCRPNPKQLLIITY